MCEPYLDLNSSKSTVKLTRIQLGTLSSRRVRACAFSRPVVSSSCGPPGSSEYALLQAQILEWVAIPFSRGSSRPGMDPRPPTLWADSLPPEPQGWCRNEWRCSVEPWGCGGDQDTWAWACPRGPFYCWHCFSATLSENFHEKQTIQWRKHGKGQRP